MNFPHILCKACLIYEEERRLMRDWSILHLDTWEQQPLARQIVICQGFVTELYSLIFIYQL